MNVVFETEWAQALEDVRAEAKRATRRRHDEDERN